MNDGIWQLYRLAAVGNSGIRCDPKWQWTLCICCKPTAWQCGRYYCIEIFA